MELVGREHTTKDAGRRVVQFLERIGVIRRRVDVADVMETRDECGDVGLDGLVCILGHKSVA